MRISDEMAKYIAARLKFEMVEVPERNIVMASTMVS